MNENGKKHDDEVDEWGDESFPASDPPSNTPRPDDEVDSEEKSR